MNERFRYLPIGGKDCRQLLYVSAAGYVFEEPRERPQNHPDRFNFQWSKGRRIEDLYSVVFPVQGITEFESERAGQFLIRPGNLYVLFPEDTHRYRSVADKATSYYWAWFGGEFGRHLLEQSGASASTPVVPVGLSISLQASFLALLDRLESEPLGFRELAAANVVEILGLASHLGQQQRMLEPSERLIDDAQEALKARLDQPIDLQRLARSMGLNYDYFRHLFRQRTGQSPYQYHLRLRLDRAKELLRTTSLPVQQIAELTGFADERHFSRIFKKHAAISPSEWRDSHRHA